MNYVNEIYKKAIGDHYELLVADIEETNKAIVKVIRSSAIKCATINIFFKACSWGKSKGVVHLLEHSVCKNVYRGMNLMQSKEVLKEKGIYFNALTGAEIIGFHYMTDNIYDSSIYTKDTLYQNFIKEKNFKAFSDVILESFDGIVNSPIDEEFMNKEREIIYAEIQTRNPGDSYDITKIHMLNYLLGGDYSAIGNKSYLENVSRDTLEVLRRKLFTPERVLEIKISVPENVKDEEIKELVNGFMSSLEKVSTSEASYDVDKVDEDILKCVFKNYEPDEINFSNLTIDSSEPVLNIKREIYDYVTKPNATEMMKAVFVLPTVKAILGDGLVEFNHSNYAWIAIKLALTDFYRDKYPYLYRSQLYSASFAKDSITHIIYSIILDFEKDFEITKFNETLEEFKNEYLDTVIDKYLNILMIEKKSLWLGYMSKDFVKHNEVFHYLYCVSPADYLMNLTAKEYMEFLRTTERNEDSAFPSIIINQCKDNTDLFEDIKKYIKEVFDKCQLVVFKVSEKQLEEKEIAKVMTEEKGE